MLILRLQRTGTKNSPAFRVVLAQSYRAAGKKAIEVLGHYNPKSKDFVIKDQERLNYWVSQHVAISPTVHNLLVEKKLLSEKKVKAWQPKRKESVPAPAAAPATPAPVAAVETPAPAAPAVETQS
jgi:small subunit ribosomal protein S16